MSSSPDLSRRARLALAALLLVSAWGLPRVAFLSPFGGTLVPLAAGVLALVFIAAGGLPLGLWPDTALRSVPEVSRGVAIGCLIASALVVDGNAARAAALGSVDPAALVALLAGAGAWAASAARARQRPLARWYLAAAAAALGPMLLVMLALRPQVSSGPFLSATIFFLAADGAVLLATEELAFRRALLGSPKTVRLSELALVAIVFGGWHALQPAYGAAPGWTLLGTAVGGFVTGCLYALSGSLSVAAIYHALHNAPLKALGGVPVAAGQSGLAGVLGLAGTGALAVGLGWMVWRRGVAGTASLS